MTPRPPDPEHPYGIGWSSLRVWRTKGREPEPPPEDPDRFPNAVADASPFGPAHGNHIARELIDGEGPASVQYRKRMVHARMREEFLRAKVDRGEPPEWHARGEDGEKRYEFFYDAGAWRLERVTLLR